jgi:hypothetical protein
VEELVMIPNKFKGYCWGSGEHSVSDKKASSSVVQFFIAKCLFIGYLILAGCASAPLKQEVNYDALPRSVLIMPPLNNSVEVVAPFIFMASISEPIAEKGYYVFPVAVVERLMRENGMPTPAEMNNIPREKIREIIGADAILYTTINDWGQKFEVIQTRTIVDADMRLVDAATGEQLWRGRARSSRANNASNQGILATIITSAVDHIANTLFDKTFELAKATNKDLIYGNNGPPDSALKHGSWEQAR